MPEQGNNASASAGSANVEGSGSGNGQIDLSQYVSKAEYDNLFSKLGEVGNELGEHRAYVKAITPLMSTLEKNPEVYNAILAGKIDDSLAKAVVAGQLTVKQAEAQVVKAEAQVAAATKGQSLDPEQLVAMITKQVNDNIEAKFGSVKGELDEFKATNSLEREIEDFIAVTPDIAEYSDRIQEFLDTHPDVQNIKNAYLIVKGMEATEQRSKAEADAAAEYAKQQALNVGGAGGQGNYAPAGQAQPYVQRVYDPNTFGM